MLRCLFIVISIAIFNNLASQIVVNEIIFENDSILKIEIFNKSAKAVNIKSVNLNSDSFQITKEFQNYTVQSLELSLAEIRLSNKVREFAKVSIRIVTEYDQYSANFNGCVLMGESAGRSPDVEGDFIIYNNSQISPGKSNLNLGIVIKRSSKTKFSPRDSSPNAALYYNNYYWIFGGWDYNPETGTFSSKANIWKSEDGLDWSLVNENPPFTHYSSFVVFKNKMMVYCGDAIFVSEDGLIWDRHFCNCFYYENYRYVVFKDKLYAFSFDEMYVSDDGINWTLWFTDFPWDEVRYLPAIVAGDNRFWMYGGLGYNDVWTSTNGLHWEKILDEAPWSRRIWFNYTYFDNKLWMIAGNNQNKFDSINFGNLHDFWYSSDGVKWKLLETDTTFYNRHGSFLWNDGKRVLISSGFGNNDVSRMYNDIWELDAAISLCSPERTKGQILCINTPLNDINYAIKGGTGVTVSGLPEGVKDSYAKDILTISGTPTVSGSFNYTITIVGPKNLPPEEGTITISPDATIALSSASGNNLQTLCVNTPLTNITYKITDCTEAIVSGLPEGVKGSYAKDMFTISGTPILAGTFNYTVTSIGLCNWPTATGTITVNPGTYISLSSAAGTDEQFLCMNTQLNNITYSVLNSTGATISGLPQGVIGTYKNGVITISGIPTESGDYTYSIAATGLCNTSTTEGKIRIFNSIIFPNPSNGTIKISVRNQFLIRIYNMAGNQIFFGTYLNDNNIFEKDFSSVFQTNGIYLIVIKDFATGYTYSQKIVVIL